jgi:AcrR family transcriptional regulator
MTTPVRAASSRALQAEQTRQQILATAQRLFAERGYDATSLQLIADEMGLTKAAVYYHFRAKGDILHAALLPGIERLKALVDETAAIRGRRARLEHMVEGFIDFLVQNRAYAVMAALDPAAKRSDISGESLSLRHRALAMLYGDHPTGAERLAFETVFYIPETLPRLTDLSDDELRDALRSNMLRILRVLSLGPGAGGMKGALSWSLLKTDGEDMPVTDHSRHARAPARPRWRSLWWHQPGRMRLTHRTSHVTG